MEKAALIFRIQSADLVPPAWGTSQSYVFLNPRFSQALKTQIVSALSQVEIPESSLVLTSSGSEGQPKVYLFSQRAFLNSANRVKEIFKLESSDQWLCPLPLFHVGALSIYARAFVSGSSVELFPFESWSASKFIERLAQGNVTHTSLVPTQLSDLVKSNLKAPEMLKKLFLGGDRLSQRLFEQARDLGWPVVPTYGMTETCGMIAYHKGENPFDENGFVKFVPMLGVNISSEEALGVRVDSLFLAQLENLESGAARWMYRNEKSHWISQDIVKAFSQELEQGDSSGGVAHFVVLGRRDQLTKVRGELVDLKFWTEVLARELSLSKANVQIQIGEDGRPVFCVSELISDPKDCLNKANALVPAYLKMKNVKEIIAVDQKTSLKTWKS